MTITPQTNATLEQIADVVRAHDTFALCGHVSPDGDCLGSQLALKHALEAIGKQVTCLLVQDEPISPDLIFMPGASEMIPASEFEGEVEVFMGLDVPTRERIGKSAAAVLDASQTSVTIDHHAWDVPMCEYVYVDPDCASASMIVWELVKLLCDEPPKESALCAYVGLATDTGGFRFQNCDTAAFMVAAELVGAGADPAEVAVRAFQNRTFASLKLEALVLDRMQVFADGACVVSWLTQQDFDRYNAKKSDAEEMVDALRSLGGVRVACMLREQDGAVRGSLRSKDETNVRPLACEFGGGGHDAAAGFTLTCTLEEAVELLKSRMVELVA